MIDNADPRLVRKAFQDLNSSKIFIIDFAKRS